MKMIFGQDMLRELLESPYASWVNILITVNGRKGEKHTIITICRNSELYDGCKPETRDY